VAAPQNDLARGCRQHGRIRALSSRRRYIGEHQHFQFDWKSLIGCKLLDWYDGALFRAARIELELIVGSSL
jgi:hypothetical protein